MFLIMTSYSYAFLLLKWGAFVSGPILAGPSHADVWAGVSLVRII